MPRKKGVFIAFEGLDGSGSSTQVEILTKNLNSLGIQSIATKEPTNNIVGGLIRGVLTKEWRTSPEGLQLLFAADRAHHLKFEILPALESGKVVITDRYFFSTIAFGSLNMDTDWLVDLNKKFPIPDITFLIKVRAVECISRISQSRNRFELFEEEKKLKRVWKTYELLAKNKKNNIQIIDGEQKIDEIAKEILNILERKIFSKEKQKIAAFYA